jgi:hypothetical protein
LWLEEGATVLQGPAAVDRLGLDGIEGLRPTAAETLLRSAREKASALIPKQSPLG